MEHVLSLGLAPVAVPEGPLLAKMGPASNDAGPEIARECGAYLPSYSASTALPILNAVLAAGIEQ
ncbi:hypothetical protein GCM10009628_00930 [Paeniglutamicibacter kerguelensis]